MAKKQKTINNNLKVYTVHKEHLPYAYVDPENFIKGSNKWGEQSYKDKFDKGFELGSKKDIEDQLNLVINSLKDREANFINVLQNKGIIKSQNGEIYQLDLSKNDFISEEQLSWLEEIAKKEKKSPKESKKQEIDFSPNEENVKRISAYIESLFIKENAKLEEYMSPLELYSQIKDEYLEKIKANEEISNPYQSVALLKLITNMIAWYEKNPSVKERERQLYDTLKNYRAAINKKRKSKIRGASANLKSNGAQMSVKQMLQKMEKSIQGQINQQKGAKWEEQLVKNLVQKGFIEEKSVKSTGKYSVTIPSSKINSKFIDLDISNEFSTKEFSAEKLLEIINKNRDKLRSPKSDITIFGKKETFGISVKNSNIFSAQQQQQQQIALHHGTYISLIRFLSRYKGGESLAAQLSDPKIMHTVLNLVRGKEQVSSETLDKAAAGLAYAFIGANNGDIFTEYGSIVQEAYDKVRKSMNNVCGVIDGYGNMRLVSSLLEEIRDNLNKTMINVVFEGGKFNYITKSLKTPYTKNVMYSQNFAKPSDFSSIEATVYMTTF